MTKHELLLYRQSRNVADLRCPHCRRTGQLRLPYGDPITQFVTPGVVREAMVCNACNRAAWALRHDDRGVYTGTTPRY